METCRYLIILVIAGLVTVMIAPAATAYHNALDNGPHAAINELAFSRVQSWMADSAGEPYLKKATFSQRAVEGCDAPHRDACDNWSKKSAMDWVIYGGFSADTPLTVALSHGYNPETDRGWDGIFYGSHQTATNWTVATDNRYSFTRAKEYLTTALASPTGSDGLSAYEESYYGNAWRSIGESMHMVSDMTVPSHVWIDPHPLSDPLEDSLTRNSVIDVGDKPFSSSVDYDILFTTGDITRLMKNLASWTRTNFYSEDTIPDIPYGKDGYAYRTVDGESVPAARMRLITYVITSQEATSDGFVENRVSDTVTVERMTVADKEILSAQKERIIPAAVQGSAITLWAILPRFEAKIDRIVYNPGIGDARSGQTVLEGSLVHHPTKIWPSKPAIGNGAFIQVNDKAPIRVLPSGNGGSADLSKITYIIQAIPGDKVRLFYDFGGYVINSDEVTLPPGAGTSVTTSPPTARKTTPAVTTTQATISAKTTLEDAPPGITCSEWSRSGFGVNNRYCCGPAANGTEVCHITQGGLRCNKDQKGTWICCNTIDDCVEW